MKLNQICVSLELAKELKEAGYPQKTYAWWIDFGSVDHMRKNNNGWRIDIRKPRVYPTISAPTASELLEQLPVLISVNSTFQGNWFICSLHENCPAYGKIKHEEIIDDDGNKDWFTLRSTGADSAVNALAKMWLYLKQNNLLTKEETK